MAGQSQQGIHPPRRRAPNQVWADEADVVVVGAGIAGLALAAFAVQQGQSVIVVEKAADLGGTAAKAVGGMWVPQNRFMREAGVEDSPESATRYVARMSRPTLYDPQHATLGLPAWEHEQILNFCENAAPAFEAFEALGADVLQDPDFPDYHTHLADVETVMGRELYPKLPDGSLGTAKVLLAHLEAFIRSRGARIVTGSRVVGVHVDEHDTVVGVRARTPGGDRDFGAAKGVALCSGGFSHNDEMRRSYLGGMILGSCAALTNEGDGQLIAQGLGAPLVQMDSAWLAPISLERCLDRDPDVMGTFATPGDSLIFVNGTGRRVVNEKAPYHDKVRTMHAWDPHEARYPNFLLFAVWDQRTDDFYAGRTVVGDSTLGNFIPHADDKYRYTVVTGRDLAELADALKERVAELRHVTRDIDVTDDFVEKLEAEIARFNDFARQGKDADFRRGETPIELAFHGPRADGNDAPNATMYPLSAEGPYFATILAPGSLDTKGGPRTDTHGRVLDAQGEPIRGLFAVGNAAAAPTGNAYPSGGLTFGPFVTMAWLASQALQETPSPGIEQA